MKNMSESVEVDLSIHLCLLPQSLLFKQHTANHTRDAIDISTDGPQSCSVSTPY